MTISRCVVVVIQYACFSVTLPSFEKKKFFEEGRIRAEVREEDGAGSDGSSTIHPICPFSVEIDCCLSQISQYVSYICLPIHNDRELSWSSSPVKLQPRTTPAQPHDAPSFFFANSTHKCPHISTQAVLPVVPRSHCHPNLRFFAVSSLYPLHSVPFTHYLFWSHVIHAFSCPCHVPVMIKGK